MSQAWIELNLPSEATYEDLVSIKGKQKEIQSRHLPEPYTGPRPTVQCSSMSFLSTWAPREIRERPEEPEGERPPSRNIHHFCTETAEFQLPKELQNIGRKYHTPDRFPGFTQQPYRVGDTGVVVVGNKCSIFHTPDRFPGLPQQPYRVGDTGLVVVGFLASPNNPAG